MPLVIKLAHGTSAGKRVEDRVELADIMPTLLGSVDIAVPEKVQGQSLLGFLQPGTPEGDAAAKLWQDRGAYSTADYGHIAFAWSAEESLRSGKYLYIEAPRRELYEDALDPKSLHNLAAVSPAVADTLSSRLKSFQQLTTNAGETPKVQMDEERMEKLAVLGYMAARPDSGAAVPGNRGADPKDKIQAANAVLLANNLLQNGDPKTRCITSPPQIKRAAARFPDVAMLHFFLGGCYMENKDYAAAIPELRQVLKLEPGFTKAELNLGRALMQTEDFDAATLAFEHVAKSEPGLVQTHIYLIVLYGKANRFQDQIAQCHDVLKVLPRNFGANLNLGRALLATGDAQGAVAPLQKAMEGEPKRPGPHATLAEVYERLGRQEEAGRERAEAERLSVAMNGTTRAEPGKDQLKPE